MESAIRNAYGNAQKWGQVFGVKLPNLPQPQGKIISPLPSGQGGGMPMKPIPTQMPNVKPKNMPAVKGASIKPVPAVNIIKQNLDKGFKKYGSPPIATMSAALAEVGHEVAQRGGNPYLPAALTIKETSGLKHAPAQKINNPAGIGPGISYPNLDIAIRGGGTGGVNGAPQKGLRGVLQNPVYDEYYKTGNLVDFFKRYTPQESHNNPSYAKQIQLTNEILSLFEEM